MYRILSISGGGVRGIVPALILDKISKTAGKNITDLFDYVVGTSVGGILASGLTVKDASCSDIEYCYPKYTTEDLVDMLKKDAQVIFPQNSIGNWPIIGFFHNLYYPKYSRDGIDMLLTRKFGNETIENTIIPISTISYSLDQDKPREWSTYKARSDPSLNYYLRDAAGATSAAPTYFSPKITTTDEGEIKDVDGGIIFNSPIFIGIDSFCKKNNVLPSDLIIVSISTGSFAGNIKDYPSSEGFNPKDINLGAVSAGVAICAVTASYTGLLITIPVCFVSILTSAVSHLIPIGYGMLGWGSRGLVDIMLNNKDIADMSFASKLLGTIVINPTLDSKHIMMDDSSEGNLRNLERAVEDFTSKQGKLWSELVSCLESKNSKDIKCNEARRDSTQFVEQYNFFDQVDKDKIPSFYSHNAFLESHDIETGALESGKGFMLRGTTAEQKNPNPAEDKELSELWETIRRDSAKRLDEFSRDDDYVIDFSNVGIDKGIQILENETTFERSEKVANESLALLRELGLVEEANKTMEFSGEQLSKDNDTVAE